MSFAGALASTNAVKTTIATSASPAVYTGAALNGALAGGQYTAPRTISATTSASAGAYVITTPITINGTDVNGNTISDSITLTATGGGETKVTSRGFVTVTEIDVPAMANTAGAFTFGVQDVVMAFRRIRIGGAGAVKYQCQQDGSVDTIPAGQVGETLLVAGVKLFGDAGTAATNITLGV